MEISKTCFRARSHDALGALLLSTVPIARASTTRSGFHKKKCSRLPSPPAQAIIGDARGTVDAIIFPPSETDPRANNGASPVDTPRRFCSLLEGTARYLLFATGIGSQRVEKRAFAACDTRDQGRVFVFRGCYNGGKSSAVSPVTSYVTNGSVFLSGVFNAGRESRRLVSLSSSC